MENKKKTVFQKLEESNIKVDEINNSINDAKDVIIGEIRNTNIDKKSFDFNALFDTCLTIAITKETIKEHIKIRNNSLCFYIGMFILNFISFLYSSIYIKSFSYGGIFLIISLIPLAFCLLHIIKTKPAMLSYNLPSTLPVKCNLLNGKPTVYRRIGTSETIYDTLFSIGTFLDCALVASTQKIPMSTTESIYFVFALSFFIGSIVLNCLSSSYLKKHYGHYTLFYIKGFVKNNGVQPIEGLLDFNDFQVLFTIDEYNEKYPYFVNAAEYVAEELNSLKKYKE